MLIHFTGVAGAGMSAAALMMREAGHQVSGSDEDVFPPMSTYVEGLGFPFHRRFDAANLPEGLDLLVLGASAKLGGEANPEVVAAHARGVRITTFPDLVGEATLGRLNTVVAGSPSLPETGHWGRAAQVVLEGDEYIVGPADRRSKFLLYHPRDVLLTSLVHDHVNVFPTFAEYEAPFRELLGLIPTDGLLVAREHPAIRAIADEARCRVVWYDTGRCDGWWADEVSFGETSRFTLVRPDGGRIAMATSLLCAHNIENIVGVGAYLLERGLVGEGALASAVASFAGIRRRLDRLTTASVVPVIEGFGSSYEKARSAIEALLLHYPHRPLTVVFEPHTFSWRSADALSWYDTVFAGAARVLIAPPPTHGAASHHQSSFEQILSRTAATGVPVEGVRTADEAMAALSALRGDEVVLLLSSGPLLGLPDRLPPLFDRLYAPAAAA